MSFEVYADNDPQAHNTDAYGFDLAAGWGNGGGSSANREAETNGSGRSYSGSGFGDSYDGNFLGDGSGEGYGDYGGNSLPMSAQISVEDFMLWEALKVLSA